MVLLQCISKSWSDEVSETSVTYSSKRKTVASVYIMLRSKFYGTWSALLKNFQRRSSDWMMQFCSHAWDDHKSNRFFSCSPWFWWPTCEGRIERKRQLPKKSWTRIFHFNHLFLLIILECIVFLQIGETFSYTHKNSIRYRCVAKVRELMRIHSMRVACHTSERERVWTLVYCYCRFRLFRSFYDPSVTSETVFTSPKAWDR